MPNEKGITQPNTNTNRTLIYIYIYIYVQYKGVKDASH